MGNVLREEVLKIVRRSANLVGKTEGGFKFNLKSHEILKSVPNVDRLGVNVVSLQHADLVARGVKFSGDSALYIRLYSKADFEGFAGFLAALFLRRMQHYESSDRVPAAQYFDVRPRKFISWEDLFVGLGFRATPAQIFTSGTTLDSPRTVVPLHGNAGQFALECNNGFGIINYLSS